MNESHHIDDLFRNKLSEFEMAPPMHLFDAIDKKRRKPKGFWFFWQNKNYLGLLLLGLVVTTGTILAAIQLDFFSNNSAPKQIESFPIEYQGQSSSPSESAYLPSPSEATTTTINKETEETTTAAPIASVNSSKTNQQDAPIKNEKQILANEELLDQTIQSSNDNSTLSKDSSKEQLPNQDNSIPEIQFEEAEEIAGPSFARVEDFQGFEMLKYNTLTTIVSEQKAAEYTIPALPYRNGNGVNYYFELLGGPVAASRTLNPVNEDFTSIVRTRNQAENTILSSRYGFRMAFVNRKGWSIRTGVQFTQIRESFDYVNRVPEISQVFDPNGGGLIQDTVYIQSGPLISQNNQLSMLDIPIIVGYEKRIKKWTISAHAGPQFNIAFQNQGLLINENLVAVDAASSEGQQAFRNALGMSWYTSLGLQYEIHPGVHLLIEPNFTFGQASITQAPYPVEQRYFTSGLSLGIRKLVIR